MWFLIDPYFRENEIVPVLAGAFMVTYTFCGPVQVAPVVAGYGVRFSKYHAAEEFEY
jgi:hypothetical protein